MRKSEPKSGRRSRSSRQVLESHLRLRLADKLEEDLARNYAPDVVVLTASGMYRGHDGVRRLAQLLRDQLPGGSFRLLTRRATGEMAFLEWAAECAAGSVEDGADSFLIREGCIAVQTIHYTVRPPGAGECSPPADEAFRGPIH